MVDFLEHARRVAQRTAILIVIAGGLVGGLIGVVSSGIACKRSPGVISLSPPDAVVPNPPTQIQISPIAQIRPNLPTHLAADELGNIYWSQETEDQRDVLFASGGGTDSPQATRLSTGSILAALGAADLQAGKKPATGSIQSIALANNDGRIYFYFNGGVGATVLAALGRFDPQSGQITILADSKSLGTASGMGVSLSLARGKLLVSDDATDGNRQHVRLWLHHTDASAMLDINETSDGRISLKQVLSDIRVPDLPPEPGTPTTSLLSDKAANIDLTLDDEELCSLSHATASQRGRTPSGDHRFAGRDTLLLIDRHMGRLLSVEVATGKATMLASLVRMPDAMSEPAVDIRGGVTWFVGDASTPSGESLIDPRSSERPDPAWVQTTYPSLLTVDGATHIVAIDANHIRVPSGFAAHALKLKQLIPIGVDQYLAYDAISGQVVKVEGR